MCTLYSSSLPKTKLLPQDFDCTCERTVHGMFHSLRDSVFSSHMKIQEQRNLASRNTRNLVVESWSEVVRGPGCTTPHKLPERFSAEPRRVALLHTRDHSHNLEALGHRTRSQALVLPNFSTRSSVEMTSSAVDFAHTALLIVMISLYHLTSSIRMSLPCPLLRCTSNKTVSIYFSYPILISEIRDNALLKFHTDIAKTITQFQIKEL